MSFFKVISSVDCVLLAEVYAAGELKIPGADGRALTRAIRLAGKVDPFFVDSIQEMPNAILNIVQDGDVVLCMGAGSIGGVPKLIVASVNSSIQKSQDVSDKTNG